MDKRHAGERNLELKQNVVCARIKGRKVHVKQVVVKSIKPRGKILQQEYT